MSRLSPMFFVKAGLLFLAAVTTALPSSRHFPRDGQNQTSQTSKLVFAHFMIGIVSDRTGPSDYDSDMIRAKSFGIDAFALNIGVDPFTDQQLGYAYESAANNGMKVFISFDFNWYDVSSSAALVGAKIKQYATSPAQLTVDGKVFASSFLGDGLDVNAMRNAAAPNQVFWSPNVHPDKGNFDQVDGALNWMAWISNGNNRAPSSGANVSVQQGDQAYIAALSGKAYIAPVSPWFSTHFGVEVPYSKNWVFPSDLLWYNRWMDILTLSPRFLEIITWNDYGESHYIGPLSSKHTDDGASKWANDMPHDGWLDLAKPFIASFHAGKTSVEEFIDKDELIYWYRPTLGSVNCDSTDSCGAHPDGWQTMADSVFVVSLLKSPGTVTVTSGSSSPISFNAPAGAASFSVPMAVGPQSFVLNRGGQDVLSGKSLRDISSDCQCGIYNFNAFVGTLPPGPPDALDADGLARFSPGLRVTTCQATPSLTMAMPYQTGGT